jgi:hypothetical protein
MSTILESAKQFLKRLKPEKDGMLARHFAIPMRHFHRKQAP